MGKPLTPAVKYYSFYIKELLPSYCGKTAGVLFYQYTTLQHFNDTQNVLDHQHSKTVWRDNACNQTCHKVKEPEIQKDS